MKRIDEELNTSFRNKYVEAFINLKYTVSWLENIETEFFKPYNISPQQYNILRILRGAGNRLKVQTVKERMIERSPNATRLMDKLCDKGLIVRERCEDDRRVVYVEITSKGKELLKEIDIDQLEESIKGISEKEAEILSVLLDKIRNFKN